MFHSFLFKGENLRAFKNDLVRQSLSSFISQNESSQSNLQIDGFESSTTSSSWFVSNKLIKDESVIVDLASNANENLLISFAENITDKYGLECIYSFYCHKKFICGKISFIDQNTSSNVLGDLSQICHIVQKCFESTKFINLMLSGFSHSSLSISHLSSMSHKQGLLSYKELKFKLSNGKEDLYVSVSLDADDGDAQEEDLVFINMEPYFVSNVSWCEDPCFTTENNLEDLKNRLIIENAIEISEIFKINQ